MTEANNQNSPETRLQSIHDAMAKASKLTKRKADSTTLIAVSKTRSADEIAPLLIAGHRHFGENRVAEAAEKWPALRAAYPDVTLHLIGQLQSNKANDAVALFDIIHALDRPSLAKALGKAMRDAARNVPCFIQVNIGNEAQKGGCPIADLPQLLALAKEEGITILGLMCLPPADVEPAPYFALLAELAAKNGLHGLSMGMSDDYEIAIPLGATYIRVGTALFGQRKA
jgi:PLP dependent protein